METNLPKKSHPKGLPVLFFTEMWERFSFYCMLSILALYMKESLENGGLGFSIFKTGQIYGAYIGLVYFTPLLGGLIADRYLGIRRTIIIGGLFMMAGHFLLAFRPLPTFFAALACLMIGNGLFKPNISTMLGNLYRDIPAKKDDGYNIFYMGINLGAFMSPLVAASLRNLHPIHGWHYAFAAAGVGMIISLITFLSFQKHVRAGESAAGATDRVQEVVLTPQQARRRVQALLVIFGVVVFFWMAFHQNGLTLTFWAENATRTTLNPEIFQSINPLFILMFTPLVVAFWNFMRMRRREPSTATKMSFGMLLTALAFTIMAVAGLSGGDTGRVSVWWLINAYAVITVGELLLSPMGLSLVSKLAPWKIRGLMMGGWFAATAVGNYLSGFLGSFWERMPHSTFFFILVVTSLFAAGILWALLRFLNPVIKEAEDMARKAAEAA
ncbi:MAG: MFS transporter [Candidatus Zixiibacteriota bacterium]|nr:MAG: MFS transporter [candidate division Zixibacteria bacterium]